jgi:hypothetical protein
MKDLYIYLALKQSEDLADFKQIKQETHDRYLRNLTNRELRVLLVEALSILTKRIGIMEREYERLVKCQAVSGSAARN